MGENNSSTKLQINMTLFLVPAVICMALVVWGLVDNSGFVSIVLSLKALALKYYSSAFLWVAFLTFLSVVIIGLSSAGDIRLGGPDAKPEFKFISWFAMTLCSGIGVGIVFWGVAEPMTFFNNPASGKGLVAGAPDTAVWALGQSFLHWTLIPYATYALFGIGLAYACYNKNLPFTFSSMFHPILGEKVTGPIGKGINILFILAAIGANVPGMVFATQQLSSGLRYQYGIPDGMVTWVVLILITTVTFTLASYSGIKKGIALISDINWYIYLVLIVFLVIVGPTTFMFKFGTAAIGDFLARFIPTALNADPFQLQSGFVEDWTVWYWCWWLCGCSGSSMFMVKIGRGRTVRQYICVNLVCTSIFSFIWFTVFGGTAIYQEYNGLANIWQTMNEQGVQVALFSFIDSFPLAILVIPIVILAIFFSFVTLAEAMTTSLAVMTAKVSIEESQQQEPPGSIKIFWGVVMGAFAIVLLMTETMSVVQTSAVLLGVPISVLYLFVIISTCKAVLYDAKRGKDRT